MSQLLQEIYLWGQDTKVWESLGRSLGGSKSFKNLKRVTVRPICHKVQQEVASFCITSARSPGKLSLPWEDLDAHAFPPAAILGKV